MQQSSLSHSAVQIITLPFKGPEGLLLLLLLLLRSPEPETRPYPKAHESRPHTPTLLQNFSTILLSIPRSFKKISSFGFSDQNFIHISYITRACYMSATSRFY
jgi:hypothetical protein